MAGITGAFLSLALRVARILPAGTARGIGHLVGWGGYHLIGFRRNLIESSYAEAFGLDRSDPRVKEFSRRNYEHYGQLFVELLRLGLYIDGKQPGLVRFEDFENLDAALERGKGVLVLTAHLGSYDLMAVAVAKKGYPVTIVSKPLRDKGVEEVWMREREASGLRILLHRNTLKEILKALRQNELVGFVLDQHARKDCVTVEFFGRRASTLRSLALMASRTHAPVVPIFARRHEDGTHVVRALPPLDWEPAEDPEEAILRNTQRYTKVIEDAVRQVPEQWTWIHKRWKAAEGEREEGSGKQEA